MKELLKMQNDYNGLLVDQFNYAWLYSDMFYIYIIKNKLCTQLFVNTLLLTFKKYYPGV